MHRERKLSALRRSLKDEGWTKGSEANFYCPKHEHHKRKLAVNIENDVFHCWVCGWGGHNLLPLFALGGKEHQDYKDYAEEVSQRSSEPRESKEYDRVRIPREFRPLCVDWGTPYYRQAMEYLSQRGVSSDDILTYKLGYCEDGPYAERIIIPSFDEFGDLNFFVGRGIWPRISPPYLSGKFDKDIIFNDLLVDWERPITLVEGPFDAIKAGTQAVALQGKFLSKRLRDKIITRRVPVYIALDADAADDIMKIASDLIGFGVEVHIVEWRGFKDPGEMTQDQFQEFRARAKKFGTVQVLRYKVAHSSTLGFS